MINTKKVTGRRQVRFESWDDFLRDAREHSNADTRTLGNWSPGQIFFHLAKTMNSSIDGFSMMMPAPLRWMLTLLMKRKFLYKSLPAGFKTTADYIPPETTSEDGLRALENAIDRQKQEADRAPHPGFGKITTPEWTAFHLRHAEMHMSFLKNQN